MHYQYHCGCCDKVVTSIEKECSNCGSHNIRSPYGFWLFCLVSCLAAIIIIKTVHVYIQSHHEIPVQKSLFDVLDQESKKSP